MDIDDKIWKYIDSEMSKDERQLFEFEMDENDMLARRVGEIRRLHGHLDNKVMLAPTAGFTDRVMKNLPAQIRRVYAVSDRKFRQYLVVFLLSSLLLVVVGLFSGSEPSALGQWLADQFTLPNLQYGLVAGMGGGLLLLLVFDQYLLKRMQQK